MTRRRKIDSYKQSFNIPIVLSLLIVCIGVFMTITNQTDLGYFKGRLSNRQDFVLTGPGTIVLGSIFLILSFLARKFINRKDK